MELGTRCLDVAVEVSRSYDIVGEPDPRWDRDSYETMGWVIAAAARRSPDEFFSWVRSSHVADVVTFQVAYLDDPRASDYLLDVVRGDEPGAQPFYRGQAIRALAAWRRTAAAEPAVAMLSSTDSLEVFAAAEALEVLADERALPRLHYLAADDHTSKGILLSVSRTIGRLERGEQFPDLWWFWVSVPNGRPPEYLVGARDSQDASDLVETFARSPRTMVHPPDLRADDASTDPPTDESWSRPVGHPVYRGIHRPWETRAESI